MTSAGTPTIHEQIAEVEAEIAGLQAKLQHLRRQAERPAPPPTETRPPLDGIRIVDLSWAVFGPLATQILADMGAEVIKLERVEGETSAVKAAVFMRPIAINAVSPSHDPGHTNSISFGSTFLCTTLYPTSRTMGKIWMRPNNSLPSFAVRRHADDIDDISSTP